jgi:DNA polymerase
MGITLWEPRQPLAMARPASPTVEPTVEPMPEVPATPAEAAPQAVSPPRETERVTGEPEPAAAAADAVATLDWAPLREQVATCTRCDELVANRTQTVFGVGNPQAEWLVVGEAPGAEEDKRGEPFVGRAGKLLDAMLSAISLDRGSVYIANILKCRPPNNRDPKPEEARNCRPYLERQIALVAPKLILVVGRIAAQNLLQTDTPIGKLRGQVHTLPGSKIPVVVTYHPAYLLRSPAEKRKAWDDLKLACQVMASRSS